MGSRKGTWVLARSIIAESDWLDSLWAGRHHVADTPLLLMCGQRDPTFGPEKLARWEDAFPNHRTHAFPEVGHFVPEELGIEAVAPVLEFMQTPAEAVAGAARSRRSEQAPVR